MERQVREHLLAVANRTFMSVMEVLRLNKIYAPLLTGREGVCYAVLNLNTGQMEFAEAIGVRIAPEKEKKYLTLAQEKAYRLFRNIKKGHLTSLESVNKECNMWGGAVKGEKYIHSVSGLPDVCVSGLLDSVMAISIAAAVQDVGGRIAGIEVVIRDSHLRLQYTLPQ